MRKSDNLQRVSRRKILRGEGLDQGLRVRKYLEEEGQGLHRQDIIGDPDPLLEGIKETTVQGGHPEMRDLGRETIMTTEMMIGRESGTPEDELMNV